MRHQAPWASRLAPLALAASLVLIVGAAFLYQFTADPRASWRPELAADHMKCFALNDLLGTHQDVAAVESSIAQSASAGTSICRSGRTARASSSSARGRVCTVRDEWLT